MKTRRLRPEAINTADLLTDYNGRTFTLEDLEREVGRYGIECPVSGDDITRVTHRAGRFYFPMHVRTTPQDS